MKVGGSIGLKACQLNHTESDGDTCTYGCADCCTILEGSNVVVVVVDIFKKCLCLRKAGLRRCDALAGQLKRKAT